MPKIQRAKGGESFREAISDMLNISANNGWLDFGDLGYDGWKLKIETSRVGTKYLPNAEWQYNGNTRISNSAAGETEFDNWTILVFKDDENDAISFAVVPSSNIAAAGDIDGTLRYTAIGFIGKDVNNGVYAGLGYAHINKVCTADAVLNSVPALNSAAATPPEISASGALHLTKMVNYLDEGCPEMKNIYIAVQRPAVHVLGASYSCLVYPSDPADE